jgi:hypothetical protein
MLRQIDWNLKVEFPQLQAEAGSSSAATDLILMTISTS